MKILHIFYSTIPSSKGGDVRSRDLIEAQSEVGLDVIALSSPFQPPSKPGAKIEYFAGIPYHRSFVEPEGFQISEEDQGLGVKLRKFLRIFSFGSTAAALARQQQPDVIHAHSTFFCALGGWRAARKLKVPLVYEVRSLWEQRAALKNSSPKTRFIARVIRVAETFAMILADHVVVISEGLRQEVIERGVPAHRITLIGNGVNLSRTVEGGGCVSSKAPCDWVFAYIGNISDIEGLDMLIEAVKRLRVQGWTNPVRLYGDGPAMIDLVAQARGVEGISFMGRFNPDQAPAVYSSVDIVVNPRRRSSLTDKVTPLKPLEAMAWLKPVIVSSVGGMLELVRDGETGFVFEADDVEALSAAMQRVTDHADVLPKLIDRAREFVAEERSWQAHALKYRSLYANLVTRRL